MQSKDLRIGNFILVEEKVYEVEMNDSYGVLGIDKRGLVRLENVNPIQLTEEWLVNFGFEKYEFDHKEKQYRYKDRLIVLRDGKFADYGSSVIVEHVHELQNLYFALTGEELELKSESKP